MLQRRSDTAGFAVCIELGMSSDTLAAVGRFLVEYGLFGVLVTLPPALLLTLGLKIKNRWTLFCGGGLFLGLGCAIFGITLVGITTGEVLALSRSVLMVGQTGHPVFFWVSTATFLALSLAFVGFGLFLLCRVCLPYNTRPTLSGQSQARCFRS